MCVQIANSNPLVSDRQDLSVLQTEYSDDDTVYQLKIKVSLTALPPLVPATICECACFTLQDVVFFLKPPNGASIFPHTDMILFDFTTYNDSLYVFLQDLYKKYSYIRKTRPDGNCFYRAFGFAHLESLLDDSKELQK